MSEALATRSLEHGDAVQRFADYNFYSCEMLKGMARAYSVYSKDRVRGAYVDEGDKNEKGRNEIAYKPLKKNETAKAGILRVPDFKRR